MSETQQQQAGGGRNFYTMDFLVVAVLAVGVVLWIRGQGQRPPEPGPGPAPVPSSALPGQPGGTGPVASTSAVVEALNPHVGGIAFHTAEHAITLDTRGASIATATFDHVNETRFRPSQSSEADARAAAGFQILRPELESIPSFALTVDGPGGAKLPTSTLDWKHEELADGNHRFSLRLPDGVLLSKTFVKVPAKAEGDEKAPQVFHFQLKVEATNPASNPPAAFIYWLGGPAGFVDQTSTGRGAQPAAAVWATCDAESTQISSPQVHPVTELDSKAQTPEAEIAWFGVTTKYFAALVIPDENTRKRVSALEATTLRARTQERADTERGKELAHQALAMIRVGRAPSPASPPDTPRSDVLAPGETRVDTYTIYIGPKQKHIFQSDPAFTGLGLAKLIDFGWFEFFAKVLLSILSVFHAIVGNYGVSIILLTFLVRGLLLPVSIWSQKNMLRMQKLTPELNKLKEKYTKKDGTMTPDNQRAFSIAQMDLMRKHQVNPVGCIGPIFLQIPVFVGLWNALNYSFELRGEDFGLWIHDLSTPDVLFRLPFDLPVFQTNAFSLLPFLMSFSYWLSAHLQPPATDPRALEQQKMMKWMMPLFGLMMYTMPSGLMIYFITSSTWGIVEQRWVKRKIEASEGKMPAPAAMVPAI